MDHTAADVHDCIVCVCVFVLRDSLLLRTRPEDALALLHTNLLGTMFTSRAALRSMLHTQGAAIVNIGTDPRDVGPAARIITVISVVATRWQWDYILEIFSWLN